MNKRALVGAAFAVLVAVGSVAAYETTRPPAQDWSQVHSIRDDSKFRDEALLKQAFALPVAATFRQPIDYQKNLSFCGPASLVNVMRSVGLEASQDTIFEKSTMFTIFGILPGGMTLDALADLSRNKMRGYTLKIERGLDLAHFREEVAKANDPRRRMIVNFHRGPLFGKGGGHHSPIAGYLPEQDLVLLLDVNESFGPYLVKTERLFEAVDTEDPSTHKKRGLLVFMAIETQSERERLAPSSAGRAERSAVARHHGFEAAHASRDRVRGGAEGEPHVAAKA